ncbi:MAG: hypothetical protein H6813_06305 [Phycisphaeraceae bacterium]|nr:hypothetical protein [Phycisphaeraceae bacterium]MCB9848083.1 hypothetical protein [Phycisphaeraceae bacterium]
MIRNTRRCAMLALLAAAPSFAGDLNPPAGPVAPTMKTLDEVRPGTPIHQADIPLNITAPGSYYLAENISLPPMGSDIAIFVAVSNVAIDLNGFTIDCQDVANDAFFASGVVFSQDDGLVRNGSVINANRGVNAESTRRVFIESVRVLTNSDGIGIKASSDATVIGCTVRDGSVGIDALDANNFTFRDCQVTGATSCYDFRFNNNGLLDNCIAFGGSFGYRLGTSVQDMVFVGCVANSCSTGFNDASGMTNFFYRNIAVHCTAAYLNVPNVSATPATAGPWDNISQ